MVTPDLRVDSYIGALPACQQRICREVRALVHADDPEGIITSGHENKTRPGATERWIRSRQKLFGRP